MHRRPHPGRVGWDESTVGCWATRTIGAKAIRAGAILRDGGCSFPGCDRHHQIVHRQGYTADVRPDGMHWDLTPGRMPGHQTVAA